MAAPTTNASALALFNKYADPENPFAINAEGISKFADDLEIDPTTDLRILVLLHRMGANSKPGEISQAEWNEGCRKLNVFDIEGFKGLLTRLDPGFMEHKEVSERARRQTAISTTKLTTQCAAIVQRFVQICVSVQS